VAPKISVQVSPVEFVFTKGADSRTFPTAVYVAPGSKGPLFLGPDERSVGSSAAVRVNLFSGEPCPILPAESGRMWALEHYLAFAIREVIGKNIMVRPVITIAGVGKLSSLLSGYETSILTSGFIAAGALKVEFHEE
jgi:hypothetical protein